MKIRVSWCIWILRVFAFLANGRDGSSFSRLTMLTMTVGSDPEPNRHPSAPEAHPPLAETPSSANSADSVAQGDVEILTFRKEGNTLLRNSLWLVSFLVTTIPLTASSAQTKPSAIVAGKVFDHETGLPLENAIVFLANTPIGTSSANDGTFRIEYIPIGEYELVISQVGYKRQSIPLNIVKPESLYYEIKLQAQPIQTKEVEVLGKRPGETKPSQPLFFPKESPNTYCVYPPGFSKPIGIFYADSAFYMYALDTAIVDSEKYIRMWLLYQNLSQTPYEFDAMKCARLHMRGKKYSYDGLLPAPPSGMGSVSERPRAKAAISATFGKSLEALAVVKEKIDTWKQRLAAAGYHGPGVRTPSLLNVPPSGDEPLYGTFRKSLNAGVLRRYTVYPGNSVNGFIYFPFPGLNWKATASGFPEAAEYSYTIEIITQSGSKYIEFVPH